MKRLKTAAGISLALVLQAAAGAVLFMGFYPAVLLVLVVLQIPFAFTHQVLGNWEYASIVGMVVAWMVWTGIIYAILGLLSPFAKPQ